MPDNRLTDVFVREIAKSGISLPEREMAEELLTARAKLKSLGDIMNQYANHPVVRMMRAQIASAHPSKD
jgi:hypothetical protein